MSNIIIGKGSVGHARCEGAKNSFRYPNFFVFFKCSAETELKELLRKKFFNFFSLKSSDYLENKTGDLDQNIKSFINDNCNYKAEEVWLHTMPRMFGYAFNPVSFWLCYKDSKVDAVLVEVHNTFGEKHFYWLNPAEGIQGSQWYKATKVFHVSPFFPVDGFYQFQFKILMDQIRIDINYHAPDESLRLKTWVIGELSPFQNHNFLELFFQYGWITPLVVLRIHYQAFKLWMKKSHFYSKPQTPKKAVT